jgi:hypothetical protein
MTSFESLAASTKVVPKLLLLYHLTLPSPDRRGDFYFEKGLRPFFDIPLVGKVKIFFIL